MRAALLPLSLLLSAATTLHAQSPEENGLRARLDSVMRRAASGGFSGVVRIEHGGRTLLERGYGMANRAERIAFTPRTVVQIGSNTKDFTAVAILRLQAQSKLALGDTLGKFIPGAPPEKRGITIAQLMDHRAGFPPGLGGDFEPLSREAMIDSAMHYRLLFTPGARTSYSNTGYSLLAAIIERVSGRTYDRYVDDEILRPLRLTRTGFLRPGFGARDLAHGYLASGRDNGTMLAKPHAPDGPYWNLRGNGGMLSTVDDMHRFYTALFDGETVLTRAARGDRFRPDEPAGLAGSDGVNFFLYERLPRMRVELIIASTNAAAQAPAIRRQLATVLGLPQMDGPDEPTAKRAGGVAPPAPVAALIEELVRAVNSGDSAALRRFIEEKFTRDPGAPSTDERVSRFGTLHERLGAISVEKMEEFRDGPMEVSIRSAVEGPAVLRVQLAPGTPPRIRAIQVMVGS
jgi:CubicO group peptidase (beta-lactamase class C family)